MREEKSVLLENTLPDSIVLYNAFSSLHVVFLQWSITARTLAESRLGSRNMETLVVS